MLKEKNSVIRKAQFALDLCFTAASFYLAYALRPSDIELIKPLSSLSEHLLLLYIILPLWSVLLAYNGSYESIRLKTVRATMWPVVKTVLVGGGILMAIIFFFKMLWISRSLVLSFLVIDALLLVLLRVCAYHFIRYIRRRGHNFRSILVIGTGKRARDFARMVDSHADWGLRTAGFVDVDPELVGTRIDGREVVGVLDDLEDIFTNNPTDEIVFVGPRSWHNRMESIVASSEEIGVRMRIACDFYPLRFSKIQFDTLDHWPLLTISPPPHYGELFVVKRALDLAISFALLAVASPVLIASALAIKLNSPGPVFFTQERCGMNGRRFHLLKFRTMVRDAESLRDRLGHLNEMSGPVFKVGRDPRVTSVGRVLRKFSIDEFPQFINVLKGDMSIVGPRPPIPSEVEQYDRWQRRRLSVPPGITCLWQVNGRNAIGFDDWMKLDLEYIDNWSWTLDMKIVLKTIPAVLRGTGA